MKLHLRIFFAYFLIIGIATYYLLTVIVSEIKPAMRQSAEEVLVDIANVLAEVVEDEFSSRELADSQFAHNVDGFIKRSLRADIYFLHKSSSNFRIYITDDKGIVRYHSDPQRFAHLIGEDFSRWNDVYLTLQGKYGARSTADEPGDDRSTVMYVAAPILRDGKIIGVLSVGKPGVDVQPFIDRAVANVERQGLLLVLFSVCIGAFFSFWLTRSIRKLTAYAEAISVGEDPQLPLIKEHELKSLSEAMAHMRSELEGKHYVEQYVHTLTHELKSPVAAISGAGEIISRDMSEEDFERFRQNIVFESQRMNDLINRLLALVSLERQERIEIETEFDLQAMMQELAEHLQPQLLQKRLSLKLELASVRYVGDQFLLRQALDNLLQNAIDFALPDGVITCVLADQGEHIAIAIMDEGTGVPEYALDKVYERFYSLPRPDSDKKSTGIGLSFVVQVAKLHGGSFSLANRQQGGAVARLLLPQASSVST